MPKRKVTLQQKRRIQKAQTEILTPETQERGLVISCFGRNAIVESPDGKMLYCSIRQNLDPLVAGDKVVFLLLSPGKGVIISQYPRESVLGRSDKEGNFKPIAANLSQIVIVVAIKPQLSWTLLDSYLVMAECLQIKPLIVLNKIDLGHQRLKEDLEKAYHPLGYRLCFTSETNVSELVSQLENEISVFVGQSGVGKSSLIRKILPEGHHIQTGALSIKTELGRHTTSNSKLYHLSKNGALIDSPGVREYNLAQMKTTDVLYGFPEFRNLAAQCKFRNCNHHGNVGCAVVEHVKENPHLERRYRSLLDIIF